MNLIYNSIYIFWIISDSAFCFPLWIHPISSQYQRNDDLIDYSRYFEDSNPAAAFSPQGFVYLAYPPKRYVYGDETPENRQFQFNDLVPYYHAADLPSFFVPRVPASSVPQPNPVNYAVSVERDSLPKSSTSNKATFAKTLTKTTTAGGIEPRVTSVRILANHLNSTRVAEWDEMNDEGRKEEVLESRTDRSIVFNSTGESARTVVAGGISPRHIFDQMMLRAEQNIAKFDHFRGKARNETRFDNKIERKSSTSRDALKIAQSTLIIRHTTPVSSSTTESIDLRKLNIDVNEPEVPMLEESIIDAFKLQNFTESYPSTVDVVLKNLADYVTTDVGHSPTVKSLVQSNTSTSDEIVKNNTNVVDDTTISADFFKTNSTTEIPAGRLIVDDLTTTVGSIDTNTTDLVTSIDKGYEQSTADVISTSSSINSTPLMEVEIDDSRKLDFDSNESETTKQYERFTTFATTSFHKILPTTVNTSQFSSTVSPQNNMADLKTETIDRDEITTYVPVSSSSVKVNSSSFEIAINVFEIITPDYEPYESNTEYDPTTDMSPETLPMNGTDSSESGVSSSGIETRYKRDVFTNESMTTEYATDIFPLEVSTSSSNTASNVISKLDIDNNDREEYIFSMDTSKSYNFSKGL